MLTFTNSDRIGTTYRILRSGLLVTALIAITPIAHAQLGPRDVGMRREALRDTDDRVALLAPEYPMPYGRPSEASVKAVMDRVLAYIERETPIGLTSAAGKPVRYASGHLPPGAKFLPGFRPISYEWGVTYSGALRAGEVTHDSRYTRYAADRLAFVTQVANIYRDQRTAAAQTPVRAMLAPSKLDDAGAMVAAFIKAERAHLVGADARKQIDIYLDWIANKQFRLPDGTLARNDPMPNTLWSDDLYMSVPALAQMGALTGDHRYYDDAVRQVLQSSQRLFMPKQGLYRHGWVEEMSPHPAFFWDRPNGWAIMAMTELLDVLPANYPGRAAVMVQLRSLAAGLASTQSYTGLWHQLLDRPDTYLETSASAMFAFALAHAINKGWLDGRVYAPIAILAWNGVSTKVDAAGEVEDVCVGTGMGFDAAFYAYRPRHVAAAHGYGPVLLAGAEMIELLRHTAPAEQSPVSGYVWKPLAPDLHNARMTAGPAVPATPPEP